MSPRLLPLATRLGYAAFVLKSAHWFTCGGTLPHPACFGSSILILLHSIVEVEDGAAVIEEAVRKSTEVCDYDPD